MAVLAAAAVAQSPAVSQVPVPGGIEDTNWSLRELVTGGIPTSVAEGAQATLDFVDGVAGGSAGCNRFSAPYTVDATALVFGPIMATRTGCDEASTALATSYLSVLPTVATYAQADGTLTLTDATGAAVMTFASSPMPQVEGEWMPTSFNDGSSTATLPADGGVTLAFGPDGRMRGYGGCNDLGGPYGVNGTDISIGPLTSTTRSCGAGLDDREQRYMTALQTAMTWAVTADKLELRDYDGNLQVAAESSTGP